jgi:ElaB/YqjD/DUF883 family membrane-anchored ribosome-binding protein
MATPGQEKKDDVSSAANPRMSTIPGGKQGDTAATANDFFRKGQEIAEDVAGKAKEYSAQVAEKASEYASEATDEVSAVLRKYPLQSLLVGFGLGCLVGVLFNRKD